MITCKEDLMNTYIENDFGELRKTYIDKAIELGYNHQGNRERGLDWYDLPYIAINDSWDDAYVGQTSDAKKGIRFSESKMLTLSDLKPTPTKFVKVKESIFDLKGEFEHGELYQKPEFARDYSLVSNVQALASALDGGFCYRQVEVDWRDEVKKEYDAVELPVGARGNLYMGESWDEQEFVKFCHLVASLTEKPEGA
ncbi:hypothetical protein VPHF27_0014 [Vibrio phage F27]|nr:conserved hypothetical protein [Vibrio phage 115E34-1]